MLNEVKRGPTFQDWGIRAILNTKLDTWPPEPIDASKPYKWQTRRLTKLQPPPGTPAANIWLESHRCFCPYPPGVYYVREALQRCDCRVLEDDAMYAEGRDVVNIGDTEEDSGLLFWDWQRNILPACFMPRAAARLFIRIRKVRVERVQDITCKEVAAEGLPTCDLLATPEERFAAVWDEIHGKGAWARNDWVFVYEFERVSQELSQLI